MKIIQIAKILLATIFISIFTLSIHSQSTDENVQPADFSAVVEILPQPREVIVVYTEYEPLFYINEDGQYAGFYVELMRRVLGELGIEYTEVFNPAFPEVYRGIVDGTYDAFLALLRIEERENFIYWPKYEVRSYYSAVYSSQEHNFESPESIRNKRIGLIKYEAAGEKFIDFMNDLEIEIQIKYFQSISEMIQAYNNNEIDAFVASSAIDIGSDVYFSNFFFSPFSDYIVTGINNDLYIKEVVESISERIHELKMNRDSYYYDLYRKYHSDLIIKETPAWIGLLIMIISSTLILSFFIIKVLNNRLLRTNKELHNLNQELEEKIDISVKELSLVENLASIGRLTASLSHEINTPIGVAHTTSSFELEKVKMTEEKYHKGELTEEGLISFFEESKDALNLLSFNIHKAAELVANMKRLSSNQVNSSDFKEFEVRDYIYKIWQSIKLNYKNKNVELHLDCDEILIKNDIPSRFYQVLSNYFVNSFEHGFDDMEEGNIWIVTKVNDKKRTIFFSYEDDGVGIKKQDLNKIWEPFYTTKRAKGHTGLGMPTIYNILKLYNVDKIKVKNREGGGFHISYEVPIKEKSILTKEKEKFIIE